MSVAEICRIVQQHITNRSTFASVVRGPGSLVLVVTLCFVFQSLAVPVAALPRVFSSITRPDLISDHWQCSQYWRTRGIRCQQHDRVFEVEYEARTMGQWRSPNDRATAHWPIGADPFELQFVVNIVEGRRQEFFESGVAIALCSRPPDLMTPQDLSLVFHVHYAGIAMAAWKGWFLNPDAQQLSRTTGGGDNLESVAWHTPHLRDVQLQCAIRRNPDGLVTFQVSNSQLPHTNSANPWCEKQWKIPVDLSTAAFETLVVQRVPVKNSHLGYPEFVLRGSVSDFQGCPLSSGPIPQLESYTTQPTESDTVVLNGQNLGRAATVTVGGIPASRLRVNDGQSLSFLLPDLPKNASYPVRLITRDGLSEVLPGGIRCGLTITNIDPPEFSPEGGDVAILTGSGFSPDCTVWIGDRQATVLPELSDQRMQILVPPGTVGPVQVRVVRGDQQFVVEGHCGYAMHPTLLWTADEFPGIKLRYDSNACSRYRERIASAANSEDRICQLLMTAISESSDSREQLLSHIREVCRQRNMIDFACMNWAIVALTYDSLFTTLTPSDRRLMYDYLCFVVQSSQQSQEDWFMNPKPNPSNTIAVSNANAGIAALAIRQSYAPATASVIQSRRRLTQFVEKTVRPDGGYIEGSLYWDFSFHYYCLFMDVFRRSGFDPELNSLDPNVEKAPAYVRALIAGDGRMLTFNDTQPWLTGLSTIAFLHRELNDPLCGWLADHMVEMGAAEAVGLAFLWQPSLPVKKDFLGLPRVSALPDLQLATLRSGPQFVPDAVVAVTAPTGLMSHHKQDDHGNFVYYSGGESVVIDPGYYQPEASCHSVPLITKRGPGRGQNSRLLKYGSNGDCTFAVVDVSQAYPAILETSRAIPGNDPKTRLNSSVRIRRTFVLKGKELLILDDIAARGDSPLPVTTQLQLAAAPQITDPHSITMPLKNGTEIQVSWFGPELQLGISDARDFGRSWEFRKLQLAGQIDWYTVSGEYQAHRNQPLVTLLGPSITQQSQTPSVDYRNDEIVCTFSSGSTCAFDLQTAGWELRVSSAQDLMPMNFE